MAQDAGGLPLTFRECGTLAEDQVRRITRIELGRVPHAHATVEVQCTSEAIEVRARQDEHSVAKAMSTAGVDETSRARLVALAAAELLLEVERLARAELEPPAARPLPPVPMAKERYRVLAGFSAQVLSGDSILALGPVLSLEAGPEAHLSVYGRLEAMQGERKIHGGDLRLRMLMGELGLRAHYPRGAHARLRGVGRLGVLVGREELAGTPRTRALREGASFSATNFGVRCAAGGELTFLAHGLVALELGLARHARTLRAKNEGARTAVVGPWATALTLSLGARW